MFDDVALHNVGETVPVDGGQKLVRVPESVRADFNEKSRDEYQRPDGAEIRFVGDRLELTVSAPEGTCELLPFWGPFGAPADEHVTVDDEPTTIELQRPERVTQVAPEHLDERYVAPEVGRLLSFGNRLVVHDVTGDVRPPRDSELPDRRLLAYGTSITQGAVASGHHLSYVQQAARRLGADAINLGSGGSAFCEAELADYLARREDWDLAVLSVSVNMIAAGFDAAEFRDRATYLVDTVAGAHPDRPVAAVTLFPFFADLCPGADPDGLAAAPEAYREALRAAVAAADRENLHLIEGPDLLQDPGGLSPDLLHPMDGGMIEMGRRLADRLDSL
jgi:lysophospholipase L1-like esterase